jgi:hypothetical protein
MFPIPVPFSFTSRRNPYSHPRNLYSEFIGTLYSHGPESAGISQSGTNFARMMPASTIGARRSDITLESANWPQTMKVTAASVIGG